MAEMSSLAKSRMETIHPSSITARGEAKRSAPANGVAISGAAIHGAVPVAKKEVISYLERSTARRETGIAGVAGKAARPSAKGFLPSTQQRSGRPASENVQAEHPLVVRSRLKPRKLYDQKAPQ